MALVALLRGVAKKTATKAVRAKKAGDKAYNTRRRYQRSAERNLKLAEKRRCRFSVACGGFAGF